MKQIILFLVAIVTLSACSSYGKKAKSSNIEVFYKDGITEEQAQQTADLIYSLDTNPDTKDNKKSFQLNDGGDTILCKMVVNEEKVDDVPIESFQTIGSMISNKVFNDKPVNLILSTNKFKPIKTIQFTKMNSSDTESGYGEKIVSGNIELFVTKAANMQDAEALVKLLDREMSPSNLISFQLTKTGDGLNSVRMVSSADKVAGLADETVLTMAATISNGVFNGKPIVFEFTDSEFNTIKTINYNPE